MHLLQDVAPEVYKAYFPHSISASEAVSLQAPDGGAEQNYKKWPPTEKSTFFPSDQIVAEDPYWNLVENSPPSLAARCIQVVARFFSVKPDAGCGLKGSDRAIFLNLLSTREPILLTTEKIPDEMYWQRCCQDLLYTYDASRHGGSYKRLFLEKHLQSCIEKFVPQQTDMFDIKDLLNVMEPYIKRLEITELLPPTIMLYPGREDDNLDDEEGLDISQESDNLGDNTLITSTVTHDPSSLSRMGPPLPPEINMKIPANHFDFGAIFPQCSQLEEFHVCYKVKNCGIEFRWNMFGMTSKDADNLGAGLKILKKLKVLRIYNSKMDDDKFYSVFDGLKSLNNLEYINFQNNCLTDESSESMIKLLAGQPNLKRFDITNNRFANKFAESMAKYLSSNPKNKLEQFNFSLNSLRDEGCHDLAEALSDNPTLHTLDISSNFLTKKSAESIKMMLSKSPGLKNLNISCNPMELEGSLKVLDGIRNNPRVFKVDVRLTGCTRDVDLEIQEALKKNRFANKKAPSLSASSRSSSPASAAHHSHSQRTPSTSKKYPYPKH